MEFDIFNGTMFILLLRDEHMAHDSELSDRAVTLETIDRLFARFRPDLLNCMPAVSELRSVDPARNWGAHWQARQAVCGDGQAVARGPGVARKFFLDPAQAVSRLVGSIIEDMRHPSIAPANASLFRSICNSLQLDRTLKTMPNGLSQSVASDAIYSTERELQLHLVWRPLFSVSGLGQCRDIVKSCSEFYINVVQFTGT
jgi:hypothetical protein